jgi:CRISP-associated protein Cas1
MQRKCNLSLYTRKRRINIGCLYCKAPLPQASPLQFFCSENCLKDWQATQTVKPQEKASSTGYVRQAEIPKDEWQIAAEADDTKDDALWVKQAKHWEAQSKPQLLPRRWARTKKVEPKPLILTGHGLQLRLDRGALLVKNGFTYYPQTRQEWRLFPGDPNLPSRIVLVDTNGFLTLDVISWLSSQQIPLVLLNWKGEVTSVFGGAAMEGDPKLRQSQLAAQDNGVGLVLATQLVKEKIKNSHSTLMSLPLEADNCARAVRKSEAVLRKLNRPVENMDALRLLEAQAALYYFGAWQQSTLNWRGTSGSQVPPQWRFIGQRASFASGSNRHATHPVNAILNYAYALLESQLHIATLAAGLDPTIGYLHSQQPGRLALVYDLMEPLRPIVDKLIMRFVLSEWFTPKDFLLSAKGVCRLHPLLVRRVVGLTSLNEAIQELVTHATRILSS